MPEMPNFNFGGKMWIADLVVGLAILLFITRPFVIIDEGVMKASGTSAELKRDLESDVLEVHVASSRELPQAAESVARVGATATSDPEGTRLQIPLTGGAHQSLSILRALDADGIGVADFQLRKPTLDDVFLAMTSRGGDR